MRRRLGLLVLAAVLSLTGCMELPEAGTVVDKSHTPGWTSLMQCGKSMCPIYHQPTWALSITSEAKTDAYLVSHEVWDGCRVGDGWHWDNAQNTGGCDPE